MCVVGLFFAPLAPLVAVAAAAVFWLSSWVYKYQLMFVFVSRVETGGVSHVHALLRMKGTDGAYVCAWQRIWNVLMNRMLVAVILMQLLMTLSTYPAFLECALSS